MGFRLVSRKRSQKDLLISGPFWHWMLDQGVGLAVHTGTSLSGDWIAQKDDKGATPRTTDGYVVSAEDADLMATLVDRLADLEDMRQEEYDRLTPTERRDYDRSAMISGGPRSPIGPKETESMREFADWFRSSGGFSIR